MATTDTSLIARLKGRIAAWHEEANRLDKLGCSQAAATLRVAAAELEADVRSWEDDLLSLAEASQFSGYSADHLGRLVRDGKIPNAGRQNAPRIRRGKLPYKALLPARRTNDQIPGASKEQIARSIVDAAEGGAR